MTLNRLIWELIKRRWRRGNVPRVAIVVDGSYSGVAGFGYDLGTDTFIIQGSDLA